MLGAGIGSDCSGDVEVGSGKSGEGSEETASCPLQGKPLRQRSKCRDGGKIPVKREVQNGFSVSYFS